MPLCASACRRLRQRLIRYFSFRHGLPVKMSDISREVADKSFDDVWRCFRFRRFIFAFARLLRSLSLRCAFARRWVAFSGDAATLMPVVFHAIRRRYLPIALRYSAAAGAFESSRVGQAARRQLASKRAALTSVPSRIHRYLYYRSRRSSFSAANVEADTAMVTIQHYRQLYCYDGQQAEELYMPATACRQVDVTLALVRS